MTTHGNSKPKLSDEHVFVERSPMCRAGVRKRILKDNLIPYKCGSCGCGSEWCGKPITLQLEHINGIRDDNRLDNLCFLCPNCHSQTSTYAGRNTGKTRKYAKVNEISDETLLLAIRSSKSIRAAVLSLGYTPSILHYKRAYALLGKN